MPDPMPADPRQPAPSPLSPDFDRGLFIAAAPGPEFASVRHARIVAHGVAGLLVMPIAGLVYLLHLVLTGTLGVPKPVSLGVCVVLGAAASVYVMAHHFRFGARPGWDAFHKQSNTDTRHRVRAVIPPKRRTPRLQRWAMLATGLHEGRDPPTEAELAPVLGGFEPIIVRPWLGVRRDRAYWLTVLGTALAVGAGIIGVGLARGSLLLMLSSLHIWGYGGIMLAAAFGLAEFLFPVYLCLAPGRLDIFRYGPFGIGRPRVTSLDLRRAGVCVNFADGVAAVEPAREPGVPVPALVLSKKWPYFQEHPPGHTPEYVCVALCPGRTEFCLRLVQGALTGEPTPPLPDDRLLG